MSIQTVEAALFPEQRLTLQAAAPSHGVRYIGNNRKLLNRIGEQIPGCVKTVADAFAGGGSISPVMKLVALQCKSVPCFSTTC